MKVVILEDNISDTWDYEIVLENLNIEILGIYKSWKEALPIIKKEIPDFLIVDLYLDNNEKGIEFIKQIRDYFIPIIVCSGHPKPEYLDIALEAGVRSFITKPIDKASLAFQIKKLQKEIDQLKNDNFLVIKEKSNLIKIPYKEIYKIEIEGNYSFIYLSSKKRYVVKFSLKKMKNKLNEEKFKRCHRSTIVNLDFIQSINIMTNKLTLLNNEELDLGLKFKASIKEAFAKNNS